MRLPIQTLLLLSLTTFVFAPGRARADLITNGNFGAGNLTGWTTFVTANGANGASLPAVVSFNTTGLGASNSAHFDVGEKVLDHTQQGGGISQGVNVLSSGIYNFSAAIASQDDASGSVNGAAGLFSILIDGITEDSVNLGAFTTAFQILRGNLTGSVFLTPAAHTFSVEITRPFLAGGALTPDEYVTNISLNAAVPEPGALVLLLTAVSLLTLLSRKTT